MSYNGHASYNAWNVSLWINNDENLYHMARYAKHSYGAKLAPEMLLKDLQSMGMEKTPDGVPYTKTNIRKAMVGM